LRTDEAQSPIENQTRQQAAERGKNQTLPAIHHFRDLSGIAWLAKEQELRRFIRVVEQEVHQTANDTDAASEHEMERFLAESYFFPDSEQLLPVPAEKTAQLLQGFPVSEWKHNPTLPLFPELASHELHREFGARSYNGKT
jgi:hypothetical protein